MLVETKKIGSVVKRLFSGEVGEILGEILQNSQRASARVIEFLTDAESGTIIITDDGSGLKSAVGTPEQFLPLITVALSNYENEAVADQTPMGVGLFSIIAHKDVSEIEVSSNNLSLNLTSDKVWNDENFWTNWQQQICPSEFGAGFRLIIKATPAFAVHLGNHLQGIVTPGKGEQYDFASPARGYYDLLEVRVNGAQVKTENPKDAEKFDVLIADTIFEGAPVKIGFVADAKNSTVNWFGQIISAGNSLSANFRTYLHIRQGTILTPKSPTRSGLVQDEKLAKLQNFVRGKVREFVLNPANREMISGKFIEKLAEYDKEWFRTDCPYFSAYPIAFDEEPNSYEDFESCFYGKSVVLSYGDDELMIESGVCVISPVLEKSGDIWSGVEKVQRGDKELNAYQMSCGFSTFVPQIGKCFSLASGSRERLNIKQLWWRHGDSLTDATNLDFVGKGEIALIDAKNEDAPAAADWQPVTCENNVYAFDYGENWNITSAEHLVIGVSGKVRDKIHFLDTDSWAVWSYSHDDASSDEMREEFRRSLESAKAALFGQAVETDCFDLSKLKRQCGLDYKETITSIRFLNKRGVPYGVRVVTASGKSREAVWLSVKLAEVG